MKINNWYRGEELSRLFAVSTFGTRNAPNSGTATIAREISTCDLRELARGTSVSAVDQTIALRHQSVRSTIETAAKPSTGKPSGIAQRGVGMGAPRGIPPRSKPKWA